MLAFHVAVESDGGAQKTGATVSLRFCMLPVISGYLAGEPWGTRTLNPLIKSQLLCQLS